MSLPELAPQNTHSPQPQLHPVAEWEMTSTDWIAVFAGVLGAFIAILDIQITNASLREIQGSLGLDFARAGWISTAYLIAEIIIIPLTGFFSNVFGMRNYLLVNGTVFIISSILCGCAWNLESMIAFRVVQGLSGGVLIPLAFQIILLYMPQSRRNLGLAIFGLVATLAPTLGPSLGGWLTDNYGWRANFLINIGPGLLMLLATAKGLPQGRMHPEKLARLDKWGTLTLILAMGTITYVLEEGARVEWFQDFSIRVCTLIALISFPLFLAIQFTKRKPLLNLHLLEERNFALCSVVTMVTAATLYGGIYALSLYLGQVQNYKALQIGEVMMWVGIPQLFIMPFLPWLMKKVDLRLLAVVGMSLFVFSCLLNTHLSMNYGGEHFRISLIIRALGQPLLMIPLSAMGMASISPAQVGNASSIYNVMRNLGGSIGIALTGTLLSTRDYLHLTHHLEHLSATDWKTMERLSALKNYFLSNNMDGISAQSNALKFLALMTHRDSFIESFSDVYVVMSAGLVFCLMLVLFLKKSEAPKDGGGEHF